MFRIVKSVSLALGAVAIIGSAAVAVLSGAPPQPAGRSADNIWQVTTQRPDGAVARDNVSGQFAIVTFNKAAFDAQLAVVARDSDPSAAGVMLSLPMPDSTFQRFLVKESPILADELAAAYPEIRTYSAQGIDDPTATARFGWTSAGFHSIHLSGETGSVYIDPYTPGDTGTYIVANKANLQKPAGETWQCMLTGQHNAVFHRTENTFPIANGTSLRTYRLALAATGEYTVAAGGVAGAVARITTTMNRVNGIYERELAVRMTLKTGTDLEPTRLIYPDAATDPYANTSGDLAANQLNIDSVVTTAGYDLGHLFGTGGGGVAALGSPCNAASKAQGLTGSPNPTGDAFDVDYVAHEIGHQFGGNHTYNGAPPDAASCLTRETSAAYEPASGVTIQGYAGICGTQNVQTNSIDRFHVKSLDEMTAFLTSGGGSTCGTASATSNTPPAINGASALPNYTIPLGTPFVLNATATDANNDTLTYAWEQYDLGAATTTVEQATSGATVGPLFRSYPATTASHRNFPSNAYILGTTPNVPPTTYTGTAFAGGPTCAFGTCLTGETMPTTARTMRFQLTVRDNRSGGGAFSTASTTVTTVATGVPFRVTSQNSAPPSVVAGSEVPVTWDVAGTNANGINVGNVTILLSTDGGQTFPTVLSATTSNDNNELVTIPASVPNTTQARIKVQAFGNIFFDVNDANFQITGGGVTTVPSAPAKPTGTAGNGFVSLAWVTPDNGGSAITGYQVQSSATSGGTYANVSACPTNTTATSCHVTGLTNGTPVFFKVAAINAIGTGAFSPASDGITPVAPAGTVTLTPTTLRFSATKNGAAATALTSVTGAQAVSVSFSAGAPTWTVSSNVSWLQLSASGATGSGTFTASVVNPGNVIGASTSLTGIITLTSTLVSNSPQTVAVTLTVDQSNGATTVAAIGGFDSPTNGATNIVGAIAVTGWALDDIGVERVEIWRNCLTPVDANRPGVCRNATPTGLPDKVFIGTAAFVPGARSDIETNPAYAGYPQTYRAGWGYLLLTNALPNQVTNATEGGQGAVTLYAYAIDREGRYSELGSKLITLNNDNATVPFGAIDTPEQGGTITGTLTANFGWAMTRRQNAAGVNVPKCIERSRYRVFIDGVARTLTPGTNWFPGLSRADLSTAYPGLCDSANALAAYYIDVTALGLANGLHTIGWDVYDDNGTTATQADDNVAGIGSRFFNILVGAGDVPNVGRGFSRAESGDRLSGRPVKRGETADITALPATESRGLRARVGAIEAPVVAVAGDTGGRHGVNLPQGSRLTVDLGGAVARGYLVVGDELRDLPIGSTLDGGTGHFYWQPAIPYFGPFELVFVSATERGGEARTTLEVSVTDPTAGGAPEVTITSPRAGANPNPVITVTGTARDPRALSATGISAVHVWAYRKDVAGVAAQFLGEAALTDGNYTMTTAPLQPGTYELAVFAWVARTGTWAPAATVTIAVR